LAKISRLSLWGEGGGGGNPGGLPAFFMPENSHCSPRSWMINLMYFNEKKKTKTLPIYFCLTRWPLKWVISGATIDNQMK
jgi:hypothetical protein